MLGNGLVLQNLLHMQLAQQQLLHIKDKRISSVRHLLVCVYELVSVCGLIIAHYVLLHFPLQHNPPVHHAT